MYEQLTLSVVEVELGIYRSTTFGKGAADRGAADKGAVDNGTAHRGAADKGAVDRGAVDRGAADKGAADKGAAGVTGWDSECLDCPVKSFLLVKVLQFPST